MASFTPTLALLGNLCSPQVVKEIVLSDNLLIEQSEQLRRMELNEVIEVFQGTAAVARHGSSLECATSGHEKARTWHAAVGSCW